MNSPTHKHVSQRGMAFWLQESTRLNRNTPKTNNITNMAPRDAVHGLYRGILYFQNIIRTASGYTPKCNFICARKKKVRPYRRHFHEAHKISTDVLISFLYGTSLTPNKPDKKRQKINILNILKLRRHYVLIKPQIYIIAHRNTLQYRYMLIPNISGAVKCR
jgi:hypothetical protein